MGIHLKDGIQLDILKAFNIPPSATVSKTSLRLNAMLFECVTGKTSCPSCLMSSSALSVNSNNNASIKPIDAGMKMFLVN